MCTLSWLYSEGNVEIFFNRDESKNRPSAIPPSTFSCGHVHKYLMPIDTQSHGSWIGVTNTGLCICLLNYYQGDTPSGELISRGLLVKDILEIATEKDIASYLNSKCWANYAPFTLVLFYPDKPTPNTLCWDGHKIKSIDIQSPYTSSGVNFPEVSQSRQDTYQKYFSNTAKYKNQTEVLKAYHHSHLPEKSKYSVCMHRDDASTVSFSHIKVSDERVEFNYKEGAPCQTDKVQSTSLARIKLHEFQSYEEF